MLSPQAGIASLTLTVKQGFEAKKDSYVHFLPGSCILYHIFTAHPQIEPGCRGSRAERTNHYTAQLAALQRQNVVFKPNAREKGNGSCVSLCMTSFYCTYIVWADLEHIYKDSELSANFKKAYSLSYKALTSYDNKMYLLLWLYFPKQQ